VPDDYNRQNGCRAEIGSGFQQQASSRIPKERPETFLLEMPVVRQGNGQPLPAHGQHRDTIRQTIAFVRAAPVQFEAGEKRLMALRDDANGWVLQNGLHIGRGFPA
jgi:hypothetical protein